MRRASAPTLLLALPLCATSPSSSSSSATTSSTSSSSSGSALSDPTSKKDRHSTYNPGATTHKRKHKSDVDEAQLSVATFGLGCYWQAKAAFLETDGVHHLRMGYMGGKQNHPTQDSMAVASDSSNGHAEVIQMYYDPSKIAYVKLLKRFWESHMPWHVDRQGLNVGASFRSVIYYHNKHQQRMARKSLEEMKESPLPTWRRHGKSQQPRTEVHSAKKFWVAKKGSGGAWPQYHCQGERPTFTMGVKNFTSAHEIAHAKWQRERKLPRLPAGWDKEVRKTRLMLREQRLRSWREKRHDEDSKQGIDGGPDSVASSSSSSRSRSHSSSRSRSSKRREE